MGRSGRTWGGILGGLLVAGIAGGALYWQQRHVGSQESRPAPPVVTPAVVADPPQTAPKPVPEPAKQAQSRLTEDQVPWTWQALPAGAVRIEHGKQSATMPNPGLVRFDRRTGETTTWQWSRDLFEYGAAPISGTQWALGSQIGRGVVVHLPTGGGFHFTGGWALWEGKEGTLFLTNRLETTTGKVRPGFLLMDGQFQTQMEGWLAPEWVRSYGWQRESDGRFRFAVQDLSGSVRYQRIDLTSGKVEGAPVPDALGYQLEQTLLFPYECTAGSGHQVKVRKDGKVLYTILDAVTPDYRPFYGSLLVADGRSALINTNSGPTLLRLADGTLQPAPELKALGTPYLLASPTSAVDVAAVPIWSEGDGAYHLGVTEIGRNQPPQTFSLKLKSAPTNLSSRVTIDSRSYWNEDGQYLQVSVNYPGPGGKCGSDWSATDTYLDPVVAKGDWKGPLQVRVKAPTRIYSATITGSTYELGPILRTANPSERFTVKGIYGLSQKSFFVVTLPGWEGILLADPTTLEWVPPAP